MAGATLKRVAVDAQSPIADLVLADRDGTFRDAYGVTRDALFLVRPDGYLASVALQDMARATENAMSHMTPPREGAEGARQVDPCPNAH